MDFVSLGVGALGVIVAVAAIVIAKRDVRGTDAKLDLLIRVATSTVEREPPPVRASIEEVTADASLALSRAGQMTVGELIESDQLPIRGTHLQRYLVVNNLVRSGRAKLHGPFRSRTLLSIPEGH